MVIQVQTINQEQLQEIADNVPTGTKGHEFRSKYHYFTSSSGDKETFWPEEGLTNNPRSTNSWGGYSWAELVRCVRTLESEGDGAQQEARAQEDGVVRLV